MFSKDMKAEVQWCHVVSLLAHGLVPGSDLGYLLRCLESGCENTTSTLNNEVSS